MPDSPRGSRPAPRRRLAWMPWALALVALLLIGFDHRDHLYGLLPYGLLLLCPLMHLFMHRGHGGHGHHGRRGPGDAGGQRP